ncbi:T9SS type A sorting domain-containing protein [Aquimarina sp. 2201CG1-2-11]|uniref:T9SS type A sorting domain-containing protein n=1 Tax=Aquimarina discodermiae TaxID=3231043 RepID=UPI003462F3D6
MDEHCGVLPWSESSIYYEGDTVSYEKSIYSAKWWTKGDFPDKRDSWKYVSNCSNGDSSFIIFLSTSKDYVTIKTDFGRPKSIKIDIYTVSGTFIRTILNEKAFNSPSILYRDISDLEHGLYIYRINIDGRVYSKKMIKP